MNRQHRTSSEQETMALATNLAQRLQGGDVITLEGPLGAGKTCFVRGLARGLGIDPSLVTSPTFTISQEYAGTPLTLVHIDAYRLHGPDDLDAIGWDELIAADDLVLAVEWPSRVEPALADIPTINVQLEHCSERERLVKIQTTGELAARIEGSHE